MRCWVLVGHHPGHVVRRAADHLDVNHLGLVGAVQARVALTGRVVVEQILDAEEPVERGPVVAGDAVEKDDETVVAVDVTRGSEHRRVSGGDAGFASRGRLVEGRDDVRHALLVDEELPLVVVHVDRDGLPHPAAGRCDLHVLRRHDRQIVGPESPLVPDFGGRLHANRRRQLRLSRQRGQHPRLAQLVQVDAAAGFDGRGEGGQKNHEQEDGCEMPHGTSSGGRKTRRGDCSELGARITVSECC